MIYGTIASSRARTTTPASTYDVDMQAWIDYNTNKGYYIPPVLKLEAMDDFIVGLKADGVWTDLDYIAFRAWNDTLAVNCAKVEFIDNKEAIAYGGLTYSAYGFKGNSVDGYLNLKFNPAVDGVNFQLNDAGRGSLEFSNSDLGTSSYYFGIESTANVNAYRNRNTALQCLNSNNIGMSPSVYIVGTGLKTQYRDNANDIRILHNGVETTGTQQSSSTNYNHDVTMFRSGNNYSSCEDGFTFFSASLTATQNANLVARLNTLLVAMGLTAYA